MRCRCWSRKYRTVWTGFETTILVKDKCEMHRLRDEMTARLKEERYRNLARAAVAQAAE